MPRAPRAKTMVCLALACLTGAAVAGAVARANPLQPNPTPETYVQHVGNGAKIIPAGELLIDGRKMTCGHRPTVLDPNLDDYGAAYPGFLILNPKLIAKVPTPVKLWIFSHECGHQFRGPDEEKADCFAVQRGRRSGWLTLEGLEQICKFISPAKADNMHFAGAHRCELMRQCFVDPNVH